MSEVATSIHGGTIVTATGSQRADLGIGDDGRVAAMEPTLQPGKEDMDASGLATNNEEHSPCRRRTYARSTHLSQRVSYGCSRRTTQPHDVQSTVKGAGRRRRVEMGEGGGGGSGGGVRVRESGRATRAEKTHGSTRHACSPKRPWAASTLGASIMPSR